LDQRRFISFLLLSLGIFLLAQQLFPQPKKPEKPPAAAKDKKADEKAGPAADAKKNEQAQAPPAQVAPVQPAIKAGGLPAVAAANLPAQFVTLGSLDLASGYRMLVTLTNTGAAVSRAEMASPRYRDTDDWSGYLGELELKKVPDGVQVQVVGPGTPAAAAKIEAGDVIVGIGNPQTAAIKTVADFGRALAGTRPNQEIVLQVRHANNRPEARSVRLIRRPFAVVRPEIDNYRMRDVPVPADFADRPSFLLTLSSLNGKDLDKDEAKRMAGILEAGAWEIAAHDEKSATFKRALPELKLEIVKRYALATAPPDQRANPDYPAYHLQLDIELHNTGAAAPAAGAPAAGAPADAKPSVVYRLDGPTGMPMEGWWYARKVSRHWSGGSLRDVMVRFFASSVTEIQNSEIAKGKVQPMGDGQTLAYAGVDGQYFSAMLIPQLTSSNDPWIETTEAVIVDTTPDVHTAIYANATCRLTRTAITLDAGATHQDSFQVFLGP
jgi:YidC/Oxa1 family membrane protein insertase